MTPSSNNLGPDGGSIYPRAGVQSVNTKSVTLYEDWDERPDGVYYKWRLEGEKDWHEKLTPYKQKPIVYFKTLSEEEFKQWEKQYMQPNPKKDLK